MLSPTNDAVQSDIPMSQMMPHNQSHGNVIKENCWKWDAKDGSYFMKYYDDYFLAQKVTFVHEELEKIAI